MSHLSFPRPSSPSPALCETPSSFFSLSPNQKKRQCLSPVFCSACVCVCGCVRAHPHTHARTHRRRLPCAAVMALSCQNIPAFTHYLPPKQPGSVCLCVCRFTGTAVYLFFPLFHLPTHFVSFFLLICNFLPSSIPPVFLPFFLIFSLLLDSLFLFLPPFKRLPPLLPFSPCRASSLKCETKRNLSAAVAFSHSHSQKWLFNQSSKKMFC